MKCCFNYTINDPWALKQLRNLSENVEKYNELLSLPEFFQTKLDDIWKVIDKRAQSVINNNSTLAATTFRLLKENNEWDMELQKLKNEYEVLNKQYIEAEKRIEHLKNEIKKYVDICNKKQIKLNFNVLSDKEIMHWTGIPTKVQFLEEFKKHKSRIENTPLNYFAQKKGEFYQKWESAQTKEGQDEARREWEELKKKGFELDNQKKVRGKRSLSSLDIFFLFCVRLRRGLTQVSLGTLFQIDSKQVSVYCNFVAKLIHNQLKQSNFFRLLSGEELKKKTLKRATKWWNDYEHHNYDCSYIYIQKSGNWDLQRLTYNSNKHRNLMKLGTIATTTGWTEVFALDYGRFTDSQVWIGAKWGDNFKALFQKTKVKSFVHMDKGMEDLHFYEEEGVFRKNPKKVSKGEKLSVVDANEGMRISSCRISIEQTYARIKAWRYLGGVLRTCELPNLEDFVACAIYFSNIYRKPLGK